MLKDGYEDVRYKKPAKHAPVGKGCPENDGKEHVYVDYRVRVPSLNDPTKFYFAVRFKCVCEHKPNHKVRSRLYKEYRKSNSL